MISFALLSALPAFAGETAAALELALQCGQLGPPCKPACDVDATVEQPALAMARESCADDPTAELLDFRYREFCARRDLELLFDGSLPAGAFDS